MAGVRVHAGRPQRVPVLCVRRRRRLASADRAADRGRPAVVRHRVRAVRGRLRRVLERVAVARAADRLVAAIRGRRVPALRGHEDRAKPGRGRHQTPLVRRAVDVRPRDAVR